MNDDVHEQGANAQRDALEKMRRDILAEARLANAGASRQASSAGTYSMNGFARPTAVTMPGPGGTTLHLFIFNYDNFDDPATYFGAEPLQEEIL